MEKQQRSKLQTATQDARKLLEEEFRSQLLQTYDIDVEKMRWAEEPGAHLQAEQRLIREKLVAWIEHKEAQINDRKEALLLALREMAFTALNRFVALKLMEARELVRPCVSGGLESAGFLEFTAVAQGLLADQESSYRLYLETIFEDVSRELRPLFDPRNLASLLWPKRAALLELMGILNRPELDELWSEDECLGWAYQYFNSKEERQEMRKSTTPRNSRELAVRNQFFTPRYVVEFLVDNTLGSIWHQWTNGNTCLKEACAYLVVDHEAKPKANIEPVDPRMLRVLDPACGSMHFGLYIFDVLTIIYREAWAREKDYALSLDGNKDQQPNALLPLHVAYEKELDLLIDIPRLVLELNIYGMDIDPRAAQIACAALWLKAHRYWQDLKVEPANRPSIRSWNIIAALPPPIDIDCFDALCQDLGMHDAQILGKALEMLEQVQELGVLLKISEELLAIVVNVCGELGGIFQEEDRAKWFATEKRVRDALIKLLQKDTLDISDHLIAQDALHSLKIIDFGDQRFDAIVMNPPFGSFASSSKTYIKKRYPNSYNDLLAAFVERSLELLREGGRVGAITSRTCFVLSSFQDWRENVVLRKSQVKLLADLGGGVMDDALVEAAAYVLEKNS